MISIIIPTFNEAENIAETLDSLMFSCEKYSTEIIVIDGGSSDETVKLAQQKEILVSVCPRKGRAAQMNFGAAKAKGNILYFLHADSKPPPNFIDEILKSNKEKYVAGCFKLKFDYQHWFLKANALFTRFDVNVIRFGDQSLFVEKNVFSAIGGFKEDLLMMEDQEIIYRIKKYGKFKIMNGFIITSARKYLDNGIYRMQGIFFLIWSLYYLGFSQKILLQLHRRLIKKHKL